MKKKTITLSKELYFYLFDLLTEQCQLLQNRLGYSDDDCKQYSWMNEERNKAREVEPLFRRLYQAVIFGEDDDV